MKLLISNSSYRFAVGVVILYLVVDGIHSQVLPGSWPDTAMTTSLAYISAAILRGLGLGAEQVSYNYIEVDGKPAIFVGNVCNGLNMQMAFAVLVLLYQAPWRSKLTFLPLGMVIIFLANVVRIVALVWMFIKYRDYFEFSHKYTFNMAMTLLVLVLWLIWVRYWENQKQFKHVP